MAAKRVVATLLFIIAFVGLAAFVFLLFANSQSLDDVPGVNEIGTASIITLVALGIIALVLIMMLALRSFDEREGQAEDAEPFFIPEADKQEAVQRQDAVLQNHLHRNKVAAVVAKGPEIGPVDPIDLASVPIAGQSWSGDGNEFSFHYPRPAKRGLFSNDYVDIGGGVSVKIATLLAAPKGAFNGVQEDPITPPSAL
jgi:hypothetical protein